MSSTSQFQLKTFNVLVGNFYKIKKRILQKRKISNKQGKIEEYTDLIIGTYNNILLYTESFNEQLPCDLKAQVHDKILKCREILARCFYKLECNIRVPYGVYLFELVQKEVMTESDSETETDIKDSEETDKKAGSSTVLKTSSLETENLSITNTLKMASIEDKTKFISMCSNIIRENFDGNPLKLNSFLDKINLIQELTAPNLENCLISFIKSKLDGKAREVLPEELSSVEQIKASLKSRITPDNSKIVAGRFAALQIKNNCYEDFSKNVEDLADALQRSLIIEGITKEKAQEMVIEQTVSICRKNAKSVMVKAILASTVFKEPKDVVAKLIIEESTTERDHQVLKMGYGKPFHGQHNRNKAGFYQGNEYRNNYRGNNRGHNNYNGSRGGNYNNRGKYNTANNSNYNQRQRGNFRGQNASVRTLNAEVPQQEMLREEEHQM